MQKAEIVVQLLRVGGEPETQLVAVFDFFSFLDIPLFKGIILTFERISGCMLGTGQKGRTYSTEGGAS